MEQMVEVEKMLNNNRFEEAEKILFSLYQKNRKDPIVNYFLGLFYKDFSNPKKSSKEAIQHFQKAITPDKPIEEAFLELVKIEKNDAKSIRILRQGLIYFPQSLQLYINLFYRTEKKDREVIYREVLQKGIQNFHIHCIMIETRFELKNFKDTIPLISNKETNDSNFNLLLRLIEGFCLLEEEVNQESEKLFRRLIDEDIKHQLEHIPHFGLVSFYLKSNRFEEAVKVFSEIPIDSPMDPNLVEPPLGVSFLDFMLQVISDIEKYVKERAVIGRARSIRGLYFYYNELEKNAKVVRDLEFAIRTFPENVTLNESLISLYTEKGECYKAYKLFVSYIDNYSQSLDLTEFDFIDDLNKEELPLVVQDVKLKIIKYPAKITQTIFDPLIERLFKDEKYDLICVLADNVEKGILLKSSVVFEIAYSYYDLERKNDAKFYYSFLKETENSSAVSNNLGLLFKDEGDLEKATELFMEAIKLDPNNKRASENLKGIKEKLHQRKLVYLEYVKVADNFISENIYIQSKFYRFSQGRDEQGNVACTYKQLPAMLGLDSLKAKDILDSFTSKKYLIKLSQANKSVYQINPELLKRLDIIESNMKKEEELLAIYDKMSLKNMEEVGYNKQLILASAKVNSQELQVMLERDLKESVLGLLSGSFKSSLILSGSIVEAVLLDKIMAKGIVHYKTENGKTKDVDRMDLSDLLYVANQEKLIESQIYHLSQAIRGYRNIIHPGVEVRKQAVVVDESNAYLAWDIARKVILEI